MDLPWTRLELDVGDDTLADGLRAELHDPLWLLARQWQMGEQRGEDGGTPVQLFCRTATDAAQVLIAGDRVVPLADTQECVEALIEREAEAPPDAMLRLLGGQLFMELLAAAGLHSVANRALEVFPAPPEADADAAVLAAAASVPDAEALHALQRTAGAAELGRQLNVNSDQAVPWADIAARWQAWYSARRGDAGGQAWSEAHWSHHATLRTRAGVELKVDGHGGGVLDWRALDARTGPDSAAPHEDLPSLIPLPLRIPGTGSLRFWEMEDAQVDLGALAAGSTEVARTLLSEFALLWGHDWFSVPLTLRTGALVSVVSVELIDTFGVTTSVPPAAVMGGFGLWHHLGLASAAAGLWVPHAATLGSGTELARLNLFVDEGSNLRWASETFGVDAFGLPLLGAAPVPAAVPPTPATAQRWRYRPFTTPPAGWVPLVESDGVVVIAELGLGDTPVPALRTPIARSLALRADHLRTEGLSLTRRWEVARARDGTLIAWIARRRLAEPPVTHAALIFDRLER